MIGYLKGKILLLDPPKGIVMVNGQVGYEVFLANDLLAKGYDPELEVELFTSHVIRETEQLLFGFPTLKMKSLYEFFLTVKGVGPKSAFALINHLRLEELGEAIRSENKRYFTQVPGVGAKVAGQIMLDLGPKIDKLDQMIDRRPLLDPMPTYLPKNFMEEAKSVLKELGFKEDLVDKKLKELFNPATMTKPEDLVKDFLRSSAN